MLEATGDPLRYVRLDVSAVPYQGAYIAKQCPVVAQLRYDPTVDTTPVPFPETVQRRLDAGQLFETEIFDELRELHPDALFLDPHSGSVISDTTDAMARGARLILGGQLPYDPAGRRTGRPDILVREGPAPTDQGTWAYLPVDVKHHLTLQDARNGSLGPARCSPLSDPALSAASTDEGGIRKRKDDALQLAHYWRMLEACGHAGSSPIGGIIGVEQRVVWIDLTTAVWRDGGAMRSTLERYDFEFDFRLDIIARALEQATPGADPPLVIPLLKNECRECQWREVCVPQLEAADHVTLVPSIGYSQWVLHRDRGITTRRQLGDLDWRTAALIDARVDVARWRDAAQSVAPDTPVEDLVATAPAQRDRLIAADVNNASELLALDATTATYSDSGLTSLGRSIDLARVGVKSVVARARGVREVVVPRARIEIDIDLEFYGEHVYLWGALVTSADPSVEAGYQPFVTFAELTDEVEGRLFVAFWEWLSGTLAVAAASGVSARAYCHSGESAENRQLRAAARRFAGEPGVPALDDVEQFIASDQWIDMRTVVTDHLITPFGTGLKALASHAGFEWRDDDPGGEQSLDWYELATVDPDEDIRADAQRRLLDYNEDDCRATYAVREWLDRVRNSLPSLEEFDAAASP